MLAVKIKDIIFHLPDKYSADLLLDGIEHLVPDQVCAVKAPFCIYIDTRVYRALFCHHLIVNMRIIPLFKVAVCFFSVIRHSKNQLLRVCPFVLKLIQNFDRAVIECGMIIHCAVIVIGHNVDPVKCVQRLKRQARTGGLCGGKHHTVFMKSLGSFIDQVIIILPLVLYALSDFLIMIFLMVSEALRAFFI